MSENKSVKLKIAEARSRDAGRGIARLDSNVQSILRLTPGDVVEIAGKRTTAATFWPGYPEDEDLDIIRVDGIIRHNLGVSIEETVTVKVTNIRVASRVVLMSLIAIRFGEGFEDYVKRQLLGRPISRGDTVAIPVLGEALQMKATSTLPSSIVIVSEGTKIIVSTEVTAGVAVPEVTYEDIGGLQNQLQRIREAIELPLKHPELFRHVGIEPPKGVLLYGPPGTGKTLLAKAVATESEANFISVRGPEVLSKWVGKSEKAVRQIFQKSRQTAPCIIFFDELDSIVPQRGSRLGDSGVTERIVNQLLIEMDGLVILKNVVVIGATNRADLIDPALLRPGRFDRVIYVPPPDKTGRLEIFKIHTKNMPLAKDVNIERLAENTEGYTGADVEAICREAAMFAAREDREVKEVKAKHFEEALNVVLPSLTKEGLARYEKTADNLRRMIA